MKYLVIIANGLTDQPIAEKDNRTPLQIAETPNLDLLARKGSVGSVQTLPENLPAGNDVSYLSLLGCDPERHHAGPAYFTAAGLNLSLQEGEIPLCCDLVVLQTSHNDMVMKDCSPRFISAADSEKLIKALQEQINEPGIRFHAGHGYQHLMTLTGPAFAGKLSPPQELIGEGIRNFMPAGDEFKDLVHLMNQAQIVLHNHPYNQQRRRQNEDTINSIWLWGNGTPAALPAFAEQYGKTSVVITESPLLRGMAKSAGMATLSTQETVREVRYREKVQIALDELDRHDVVYLHVNDAEDLSLRGLFDDKIFAIEDFDSQVVGPIVAALKNRNDVKMLITVNHMCSANLMKYGKDEVPFLVYPGNTDGSDQFDENITVLDKHFKNGPSLIKAFLNDLL